MGKRLEADDDYKIYKVNGDYYLVNTKGKLEKSGSKKYDIDMPSGSTHEDQKFTIGKKSYKIEAAEDSFDYKAAACVPHIELVDNWIVNKGNTFAVIEALDVDFLQESDLGSVEDEEEEE